MGWIDRIISPHRNGAATLAYNQAMGESGDLIQRMRDHSNSNDAARGIMADVWAQHRNIPFLTSVYETVQEMKVAPNGSVQPPPLPK